MDNVASVIDRYVAVWNESDAATRRRRIAAVWAPNGTTCYRLLDAHGYEAIELRVTGSWDRWLREGKYVFRPAKAVSHHQAIKFEFAMVATDGGKVEANGLCYLLLDNDGRLVHDYQFNPLADDAVDLAAKYLAPWNETDAKLRRSLMTELWAENGVYSGQNLETRGLEELSKRAAEAHRNLVAKGFVVSPADRSQRHHNVAHIAWRIAPRDGGAATGVGSTLLIFDEDSRILIAHQFHERIGSLLS